METKEFKVTVIVHERYTAYVEAEDWETAEVIAQEMYNNGELDVDSYSESFEAEEVDA